MPTTEAADAAQPSAAPGADTPPAKRSKLAVAMETVSGNVASMQGLAPTIDGLVTKYTGHKFDFKVTTVAKAKKVLAEVRQPRYTIQNLRDAGKKLLNGLKSELEAAAEADIQRIKAIEDPLLKQIEEHEQQEATRVARHEQNIAAINRMSEGAATMTSAQVQERQAALGAIIVDDSYEEFRERAQAAKDAVAAVLRDALVQAQQREQQAEEDRKRAEARERFRTQTQAIKDLPASVEGQSSEEIAEMLRIHLKEEPAGTAEKWAGADPDTLELAQLAHFRTTKLLEDMLAETRQQENASLAPAPALEPRPSTPVIGDEADPFSSPPPAAPAPASGTLMLTTAEARELHAAGVPLVQRAGAWEEWHPLPQYEGPGGPRGVVQSDREYRRAPPHIADAAPIPRPPARPMLRPAARPTLPPLTTAMARSPSPVAAAPMAQPPAERVTPDLLADAKHAIQMYRELPVHVFAALRACGEFTSAMDTLSASVDFINEFAD